MTLKAARNRTWRIARPIGPVLSPDDFTLVDEPVPDIRHGQVLVRTLYIGIAPGVRPLLPYAAQPDLSGDVKTGSLRATGKDPAQLARIRVGDRMQSGILPRHPPILAGAVGMLVVKMAKAEGLRVVGIASGRDKCAFVIDELAADECIDRLSEDLRSARSTIASSPSVVSSSAAWPLNMAGWKRAR